MNDKLIETFLDEARELLDGLEDHVLNLEKNPADMEALNAAFRALHSIKGAAAMFGYEAVGAFAHEVEAALDHFRSGAIPATAELTDAVLRSRDLITLLLDRPGDVSMAERRQLGSILSRLAGKGVDPLTIGPAGRSPAFEVEAPQCTWRIVFTPSRDLYRRGVRPELLVKELRALGQASVHVSTKRLPKFSELDPEDCWLTYIILITSAAPQQQLRDVFIFEEGLSEVSIDKVDINQIMDGSEVKRLGEILAAKSVPLEHIRSALNRQEPIGEILVKENHASPELVEEALLEQKHARNVVQKHARNAVQKVHEESERKSIRINSDKLDVLLNLVGELVTVQAQLSQAVRDSPDRHIHGITDYVKRLASELRATSMELRLVPVDSLFAKFKRLVRDLAHSLGKEIDLQVVGGETEIDKSVIDSLTDPLMHLVRNAADHGLETPDERERNGKPRGGLITLSAVHAGAFVRITVKEDGRGLDREKIFRRSVERGLLAADSHPSDEEIDQMIFEPGFSTAAVVSSVSGRGVGLDVVKTAIKQLGGNLIVTTQKGLGTEFVLDIPLTLAIIDGFLVRSGRRKYVIPLSSVHSCFDRLRPAAPERLLTHGEEFIPYASSRVLFGEDDAAPEHEEIVIVSIFDAKLAIGFDQVLGGYQTVIKPIGEIARHVTGVSSAAILADGDIALILDVAGLARAIKAGG
ncbi:MAG: hypothetical protein A2087_11205 [Spirochaetes bacterium GWD1_61_31]|nr:MAG: hypothetical protein A2Y37_04490 [Spirochaetes bacterium GWB1_60_80]OHD32630.1 MAG: hypothetical protein A2004_05955 [Spirochaetes bacterium GWC1_61_12]OHD35731.1 MAG: hypothetical protein A2087_11205 [Spirochaetes bacterium GWD1_61_31]OHD41897.1 MAG: hypothetical protein A2Y35_04550 [Spirochaetes bacterium GWE1_60_18]OHD57872.1 MAG: hypothetical protein A2Y32_10820 [Spirochaetes bacterium GWF1_60_12]HAP44330.1 chemotaxis protein CheA [Spirochaetaceae bacterium]